MQCDGPSDLADPISDEAAPAFKRQRTEAAEESTAQAASLPPQEEEEEVASSSPPQSAAALYHSVRVRQPKRGNPDEHYFDWAPIRRTSSGSFGGVDAAGYRSSPGGRSNATDAEQLRVKQEQQRLAKEQARLAAEAEEAAWDLAEGIEPNDQIEAMLRILHELFAPKYVSFARPFTDAAEARELCIHPYAARPARRPTSRAACRMTTPSPCGRPRAPRVP